MREIARNINDIYLLLQRYPSCSLYQRVKGHTLVGGPIFAEHNSNEQTSLNRHRSALSKKFLCSVLVSYQ